MIDKIQRTDPYNRPPRVQDTFNSIDIDMPAPPNEPDEITRSLLMSLLPMSSFLVMGLFYALVFGRGTGLGWLYALPMLGIAIFTFIVSYITFGQQKYEQKRRWLKQQRDYHRLLDKKEARLLAGRDLQNSLLIQKFPPPHTLLQRVKSQEITIWERRQEDADFLCLRLGIGEIYSKINIKQPDPDLNSKHIRRAFNIYVDYRKIPDAPVIVDLQKIGSLALVGNRNYTMPVMLSLIAQVTTLNSPEDLHLYMFSSKPYYQTWKWMRWLPHTNENHIGGQPTFMAFDDDKSRDLLLSIASLSESENYNDKSTDIRLGHPILMFFDNETGVREDISFNKIVEVGKNIGAYSIFLCEKLEDVPSHCHGIVEVDASGFVFSETGEARNKLSGRADRVALIEVDNLAHRLLPLTIQSLGRNFRIPSRVNFLQLYDVEKVDQLNIERHWFDIDEKDGIFPLEIRLGRENFTKPLSINLSENKDGPHGLIAGTTGSGKSELLQTLVASLALKHHPFLLNFLLIDFKGGSAFGDLENIPHVVGLVSNLDKMSASRALEALNTEVLNRQHFLQKIGVKNVIDYHKELIADGRLLDSSTKRLPHLFVIVDEFAQMASEMPAFLERLKEISRLGRSLGIHLVLATQRPAGVVTDEMRANLNFRISLRVQTIDDSRDLLRRPDAAYLPPDLPGRAYFQIGDGGGMKQFQVARVGAEYQSEDKAKKYYLYKVDYENVIRVGEGGIPEEDTSKNKKTMTIAKALAENFLSIYDAHKYKPLEKILLPQLKLEIDTEKYIFHFDTKDTWKSWWKKDWREKWVDFQEDEEIKGYKSENILRDFQVPVGILDSLKSHSQPPYFINFLNHGGHVLAVGGPQTGKTYFLQTLCYSIAYHYNPAQVHIYILSFAGRELEILADLPHIGSVIDGSDVERTRRLIYHLNNEIEYRKKKFFEKRAKDLADFNSMIGREDQLPYLCIMIDNFGELRNLNYDKEFAEIEKLMKISRVYGLHFVLTALQGNDVSRLSNLIQQRIAFNLAEQSDYFLLVGRPGALAFDLLPKGRCYVNVSDPPLLCQIGLPPNKNDGLDLLIKEMNQEWVEKDSLPIPIEILRNITLSELLKKSPSDAKNMSGVVGIDGNTLKPYMLDWKTGVMHYLVGGPTQSGRTSLLHTFVLGLAYNYSPEQLKIVLVDGTRSLEELDVLPHVIERVIEDEGFVRNVANLQIELKNRRSQVNEGKKKERTEAKKWPELLFVIDDYDLTSEAFGINELILSKLGRHARQDADLGFHFLISALPENISRAGPLIKQIRLARAGISLANVDTLDALGGRATLMMRNEDLPQGRGYSFARSTIKLVQFAFPDVDAYSLVAKLWDKKYKRAKWDQEATNEQIDLVRKESVPVSQKTEFESSNSKSYIDIEKAVIEYKKQQERIGKISGS